MPFKTTPEIDFTASGLITDMPAHSLPENVWTDCLNIRIKDGAVQGVNSFEDYFSINYTNGYGGSSYSGGGEPHAVTQWTPAGTDHLNIAYIIKDTGYVSADEFNGNRGRVFVFNSGSNQVKEITDMTQDSRFKIDDEYPPQIFVFNGNLIVNPATGTPQYISEDYTTSGTLTDMPNWIHYGTTYNEDGSIDEQGDPAIARIIRPFKNRLIAMSLFNDKGTSNITDDKSYNVDFSWSSHVTTASSMAGVDWVAGTINTAGNAYLTQTPGKIIDGGQLGDHFIAYKTDSVVRVYETGDTYVLGFESIFEDDGIYSNRCFANIDDSRHLVIGNYGVYLHDGQSNKEDIAKGVFQDTMFNLVSSNDKNKSFITHQTRDKEIWFCFPTVAGGYCNKAFVYNYNTLKLHIRDIPSISDAYETEVNGSLKIVATSPSSIMLKELSNTNLISDGWFQKTSSNLGDETTVKKLTRIYVQASNNVNLSVVASNDRNPVITDSDWNNNSQVYSITSNKLDLRKTGKYMNLRVSMIGTSNPELTKMQFDIKTGGKQ
jgi:hypothetical protein